ncbi:BMC domain-containing protein [Cohnella sp. WQ 127256]|uniref:BMC domain-containing protein n=1 Tax=Cohnella sp. WQ 127256 TaxID=2938790 RepID=UPI002118EBE1|nr:BMC domain-containing protein [Cohnella sp. WQ 127256]
MITRTLALGIIETWGVPALIAAADAAAKTADVQVTTYEKVDAGIVTIYLLGDVAAVKTAVEAGGEAAKRIGKLLGTHVIPRPDASVYEMVKAMQQPQRGIQQVTKEVIPIESDTTDSIDSDHIKMKVKELRNLAFAAPDFPLSEKEIKKANKAYLAKLLSERDSRDEHGGESP